MYIFSICNFSDLIVKFKVTVTQLPVNLFYPRSRKIKLIMCKFRKITLLSKVAAVCLIWIQIETHMANKSRIHWLHVINFILKTLILRFDLNFEYISGSSLCHLSDLVHTNYFMKRKQWLIYCSPEQKLHLLSLV